MVGTDKTDGGKRLGNNEGRGRPRKKNRVTSGDSREDGLRDSASIRELAKPYLLAVGRLPLDVLDTTWSAGRNRAVEVKHVRELCEAFRVNGLQRQEPGNRLLCLCSAEDVRRVRGRTSSEEAMDGQADDEMDLLRWAEVNSGSVEVMAGQHRIAALKEYSRDHTGVRPGRLWWTCELYDRDRLPQRLAIRMRLNRTDLTMSDTHGQIWMQLVSITSQDEDGDGGREGDGNMVGGSISSSSSGDGNVNESPAMDHKLAESLWLGSEHRFPTRRLVTLWKHERWRKMTTRWCRTRMGLGSFSISMFEWLASHRIDEYWFQLLDSTLDALQALPVDTSVHVTHGDWDRLATAFGGGKRSLTDVVNVFYKGQGHHRTRASGLLQTLGDDDYARVCEFIGSAPTMSFPAPHRMKRAHMQYLGHMMQHVIAWFDPPSAAAANSQAHTQQNKPLLRAHLEAAIDKYAASHRSTQPPSGSSLSTTALRLQNLVLDFTRENADAFDDCAVQPNALSLKLGVDDPSYAARFSHSVWSRLLLLVRREVSSIGMGRVLRNEWEVTLDGTKSGVASLLRAGSAYVPELIQDFCGQIARAATDERRTAASSPQAAAELEKSLREAVENTVAAFLSRPTRPSSGPRMEGVAGVREDEVGEGGPASRSDSLITAEPAAADDDFLPLSSNGYSPLPGARSARSETHFPTHATAGSGGQSELTGGRELADRNNHYHTGRAGSFPAVNSSNSGSSSSPPLPHPPPSAQHPSQPYPPTSSLFPSSRVATDGESSGRKKRPRWAK